MQPSPVGSNGSVPNGRSPSRSDVRRSAVVIGGGLSELVVGGQGVRAHDEGVESRRRGQLQADGRRLTALLAGADFRQSVKGKNTRRDPRVAISIVDMDDPYSEAQLRGRVTERRRDSDFKYIDAVSRKYVGKAWPYREEAPVALVIEIDKVHYSKQPFEHTPAPAVRKPA